MRRAALLAMAFGLSACTFERGGYFAELHPTFDANYVLLADRDVGGGWQHLATDYEIRMDSAEITFDHLELVDLGEGALSFDPSNPPPPYSLCHNGHCHNEETGGIETYEEIEAKLSGGAAGGTIVAELPVGFSDAIIDARRTLECEPSCGLPQADIKRARLQVLAVNLAGYVRDSRLPPRFPGEVLFSLGATIPEPADGDEGTPGLLSFELDLPADRSHAPEVDFDVTVVASSRLFDGVDIAAAAIVSSAYDFSTGEAFDLFVENLDEVDISAAVSR